MIDTHCHLTFPEFAGRDGQGDVRPTLEAAQAAGVTGCITIATTLPDAGVGIALARRYERVWATVGVHPGYSDEGPHDWSLLPMLAADPKVVAFGELGLDNHYPDPPKESQHRVLEAQLAAIEACRSSGFVKPVIIHCREAFDDLLPILQRSSLDPTKFVFHCFTGTSSEARRVLDFGASISFTGVLTYKNAGEVRKAAALVPAGRVMVETDAPFLSPEPVRTTRPCTPAMVAHTARALAGVRGLAFEDMHQELNQTTARFFGIDAR